MNYLKITNNGLIEKEDLTLVGSSTKRGNNDKIGEFGSGNKFSLAWYERNECTPTIFRGTDILPIGHTVVLHRDTPVKVITVDDQATSITSTMGPKWTGWMALRETISNAIDEGGITINSVINPELVGEEGKTTYFIPMNEELSKVLMSFDKYFSMNRKNNFANSKGEMFFKSEAKDFTLYRQGIRCWDNNKKFPFDINLFDIEINESRLTSESSFDRSMAQFIKEGVNVEAMKRILSAGYYDMLPNRFSQNNLDTLKEIVNDGYSFGSATMEKFAGMMGTAGYDFIIPQKLIDQMINEGIINTNENHGCNYIIIEDSPKTPELKYQLGVFNLGFLFPIKTVVSDSFGVMEWRDDSLLINVDAFEEKSIQQLIHRMFRTMPISIVELALD